MTEHDCGHTCCPIRNDRFHDHFLTPEQCPSCGIARDADAIPVISSPPAPIQLTPSQYEDVIAELRAENEELKQWASDACELLHELRNIADGESYHACVADTDALLRRMENP